MNSPACWLCRSGLLLALLAIASPVAAQGGQNGENGLPMINRSDDPLLRSFRWRVIGPVGQGGRVDDIAVVETDPATFYVGFATGGLWKTTNRGTTFEPVFDTYSTHSIGDIAIAPSNPEIVYVGSGEANNRQSSSFGDGVYRTTDGGRTWTQMGLRETQSIARVIVHPSDPNTVWVAANGHLFGANAERGVFKSTDGGRNWRKVLFVDDNTGATELIIDPSDPNHLLAATYQRRRSAWGFASGGGGSGIWQSEDAGDTWTRLSGNGLPNGSMGRIALDVSKSNPNVIFAQIEVGPDKEPVEPAPQPGGEQGGRGGFGNNCPQGEIIGQTGRGGQQQRPEPDDQCSGVWRSDDRGQSWHFVSNHNVRPMYFSQIRVDPNNENVLYTGGVSAYKSVDGGKTWRQLEGHGHVDHHAIWIDPNDSRHVMYGNDGSVDVSFDGGDTWESLRTWAVGQPYHVSVDMRRPYFVCTGLQDNGTWCGPSSVRNGPILKEDWYGVGGGDGFHTAIDPTDWAIVYSESQNGNINRYNLRTGEQESIRPRGPGSGRGGGGGGRGGGAGGNTRGNIVPEPPEGTQIRWNWNTPFLLSPHNPGVIHAGGNRYFKSYDRGTTWTMSADLTNNFDREARDHMGLAGSLPGCNRLRQGPCILSRNDGTNVWGTIVSISESPIQPGLLWVGTDDGNIQLSRDGGATWSEVGVNIPGGTREYYVSRVEASRFDPATAFASVDGHRHNDLRPHVYVTRDYGRTWTAIAGNLPAMGNVNTVRQDPKNRNLLYAGTEFGFFVSIDEGTTWKRFMNNLPVVRIDDILVHPRDNDLVLATHGRSIQIMDDISPLQQLTEEILAGDAHLFEPRNAVLWKNDRTRVRAVTGTKNFRGENAPDGTLISYYLSAAPSGEIKLTITDLRTGATFRDLEAPREAGINRVEWNLRGNPPPEPQGQQGGGGGFGGNRQGPLAGAGIYRVTLTVAGREYVQTVLVEEDRWMMER
ncbi:MAG: WD40/YVTN/BNR-like repeat-containing protein [Longimicrobiales bacterium]